MSDPIREFLAWFDGFAEGISKRPSEAQWGRIKDRIDALRIDLASSEWVQAYEQKQSVLRGTVSTEGEVKIGPALVAAAPAVAASAIVSAAAPSVPFAGATSVADWLEQYMAEIERIAGARNVRLDDDTRRTFRGEIDAEVYVSMPRAAAALMMANFSE